MRDSIVFYRSFYEAIADLPSDDFKACVRAIMEYGLNDIEPEAEGVAKTVFLLVQPQIDVNNKKYQNGTKGGRPKTKQEPNKNQAGTKSEPNVNDNDNVNANVNVKDKYTCAFGELWTAYPRKKEKAKAYKCYRARLSDGFSEDELLLAVKRYAEECRKCRTEEKYIKHAATFLGPNTPFLDYLRESFASDMGTTEMEGLREFLDESK